MRVGQFGIPGQQAAVFTNATEIFWGGDASRIEVLRSHKVISSVTRDAGNTPTTVLRGGLLLGLNASSGEYEEWDATATDGTEHVAAVNEHEIEILDAYGTATDRFPGTVVKAPLKAKALLIKGAALVGHADEYLARRQLAQRGCLLDDDPQNFLSGLTQRIIAKTATASIVASENGALFVVTGTGAVVLTLPAIKPGLKYSFVNTADQNLTIASAEGDNVIILNDASADSVAFSTANQKIGARLTVESVYVGGTLKWLQSGQLATPTTAT